MLHKAFAVDGKGYASNQTWRKCICQLREAIQTKQMLNISTKLQKMLEYFAKQLRTL